MAAETITGTNTAGLCPAPQRAHQKAGLRALQRKLERAEAELELATEIADFWQRHSHDLQLALLDEDFATHRCVGINNGGELMVVKVD